MTCVAMWTFASFQSTILPFIQILPEPGNAMSAPAGDLNVFAAKRRKRRGSWHDEDVMTTDVTPLAAVAALNLAAAISPGPAFVLITRTAAASCRSSALRAAAGTVAAS